jgi:hypothetical protein
MKECWECGAQGVPLHNHHPVPRSRGGTKTIPLCEPCHSKAHHRKKNMNTSALVKEAMARRKAQGAVFGNPNILKGAQQAGVEAASDAAKEFNAFIANKIKEIKEEGYTGYDDIANRLNELNITTRRGSNWNYNNLYKQMKRSA